MSKKKHSSNPNVTTSPMQFARRREMSLGHKVGDTATLYEPASDEEKDQAATRPGPRVPSARLAAPVPSPSETDNAPSVEQSETDTSPGVSVPSDIVVEAEASPPSGPSIPSAKLIPQNEGSWLNPTQGPIRAGLEHFNDQLYGGFSGEIRGGLDTAADVLTGNVPDSGQGYMSSVVDDYRSNRDAREADLRRYSEDSPGASMIGAFAGGVPWFPLFKGANWLQRAGNAGKMGAVMGLGNSDADLTKGELLQAGGDALKTGLLFGGLSAGADAVMGLGKLLRPKTLDTIAAHNRIAGGGDARQAPIMDQPYGDELPSSMKGFEVAKRKGLVDVDRGFVSNTDGSLPSASQWMSNPIEALEQSGKYAKEQARRVFSRYSEIDYPKLRSDLQSDLSRGREQKLAMLDQAGERSIPAASMLGQNAPAVELRTFNAITQLEDDASRFGIPFSESEASSLRSIKEGLSQKNLNLRQMEELSGNLGILTRRMEGKEYPAGSANDIIKDTKARIDSRIIDELNATDRNGLAKLASPFETQFHLGTHHKALRDAGVLSPELNDHLKTIQTYFNKEQLTKPELQSLNNSLKALNKVELDKKLPVMPSPIGEAEGRVASRAKDFENLAGEYKNAEEYTSWMLKHFDKDLGDKYRALSHDLYNESSFLKTVEDGQARFTRAQAMDPAYEGGLLGSLASKAGIRKGGSVLDLLAGNAATAGKLIGPTLQFGGMGLKPQFWQWAPHIFSSYDKDSKTVKSAPDKELHNSYVDNANLSPRDKARLKSQTNLYGTVRPTIIPEGPKDSAMESSSSQINAGGIQLPGLSRPMSLKPHLFGDPSSSTLPELG